MLADRHAVILKEDSRYIRRAQREGRYLDVSVEGGDGWPAQIAAVGKLLSEHVNSAVQHVYSEEIVEPKSPQRRRRYFKHVYATTNDARPVMRLFTKTSILRRHFEPLERFLSTLDEPAFGVAHYYGLLDIADGQREGRVGVWDFVEGRRPTADECSIEDLKRLARAAGATAALSARIVDAVPNLPADDTAPVGVAVFDALEALSARGVDIGDLRAAAEDYVRLETEVIDRMREGSPAVVSHLDLALTNCVFDRETDRPIVLDWDSTRLAPAGSSMQRFSRLGDRVQWEMAQSYVQAAPFLDLDLVLFVMRATRVLRGMRLAIMRSRAGAGSRRLPECDDDRARMDYRSEQAIRIALKSVRHLRWPREAVT